MLALKLFIRTFLATSVISLTVGNAPLVQAEESDSIVDDEFIEHLIEAEGMRSLEVNSDAVTDVMNDIILSKGAKPSYAELLNIWSNAPNDDPSKVLLALGMFSAGVSQNESEAMELASKSGNPFYDRDFKLRITEENLAGDSYSWLVDHVDFTIPKSLAEYFPKIIDEDTPYWGGTRDGYFNIEGSDDWSIFSSIEMGSWIRALDDIESPDKEVWRGSIRNASLKRLEIFRGLLVHNPNYLLSNLDNYDFPKGDQQWLNYWRYSGAYEYETHKRYQVARSEFYESLKQQLLLESNGEFEASAVLADLYIDVVEWDFTGHSSRSQRAKNISDALKTSTWKDLVGKHIWNHSDDVTLRMVGGMLLLSNKEMEFISYVNWLAENERTSLIGELIGLASIADKLTDNIVSNTDQLSEWGDFNKTPIMYAAQFDNLDAYNKSLESYPRLFLEKTIHGEEFGELPKIGNRNVLMYALENATTSLINTILKHHQVRRLNLTDSDNRDFLDFLELNELLSDDEKEKIYSNLIEMEILNRTRVAE